MKPCIKWVGGKTQLINILTDRIPTNFNNYFEPFIGGGALLFSLMPKNAHINDKNQQLINLYIQIKTNIVELIHCIEEYNSVQCDRDYYYKLREIYNSKLRNCVIDTESAALLL